MASSIRFIESNGPVIVTDNIALNTGRNFFQCIECTGGNIRINRNSLEHTQKYGSVNLKDFINIYKSEGLSSDWIQVNNNRAKTNATGSGVSNTGSYIMLGDWGGKYQEAKNNIGVNPGQVGIGAASGVNIKVENNKMYSQLINGISNVAFYSWKNPSNAPNCSNHTFLTNVANWFCGHPSCSYGIRNKAWSDGSCGLSKQTILNNTAEDTTMGPEIWNLW